MGKLILLLGLTLPVLCAPKTSLTRCMQCHATSAPPFPMIYRRYLMLYSSKSRIAAHMEAFLRKPSAKGSAMPEGMKSRFHPQNHPAFDAKSIHEAVSELIRTEDVVPRLIVR